MDDAVTPSPTETELHHVDVLVDLVGDAVLRGIDLSRARDPTQGHVLLFWLGIIFPVLWIVGALIAPTPRASGAGARRLQRAQTAGGRLGERKPLSNKHYRLRREPVRPLEATETRRRVHLPNRLHG